MAKQVLIETLTQPGLTLVESTNKELAPGVLCVLEGQIGTFDLENANKRTYPKALWENVIGNGFVIEQLANKSLYGEADHPESLESSVTRVSHCMRRIWLDESTGQVRGRLDILDTPAGRIVNTLARYGSIGISSRGSGELSMLEGRSVVDASTYEYITHDIVVQPACEGSYPSMVTENFKRTIKADIITDKVQSDKVYFKGLYEKVGIDPEEMQSWCPGGVCDTQKDTRVERLVEKIESLNESISTLESNDLTEEVQKLRSFIVVLENSRNYLQDTHGNLLESTLTMRDTLESLQVKFDSLTKESDNLVESYKNTIGKLERRIKRVSTTNQQKSESSLTEAKTSLTKLKGRFLESASKADKLASQNKSLREQNTTITTRLDKVKELRELSATGLRELHVRHTMLKIDNALLSEQVDAKMLKQYMESRNLTWTLENVKATIADYKVHLVESCKPKESQPDAGNERIRRVLDRLS